MQVSGLRRRIDQLDARLVALLNRRAAVARRIGQLKQEADGAVYVPARERQVLDRVRRANRGPLDDQALASIYREIMAAARTLERRLRVAYFGPATTFTHQAARLRFGAGTEYLAGETIGDVFDRVRKGQADYGVVPVENSIEGAVTHTLDELVRTPLKICAEMFLPISHHLMARRAPGRGARAWRAIRRVYSHPQVFGQCRGWLRAELPGAELVPASSTARAAEQAARDPRAAAIAGWLAADHHGLRVLASDIQDLSGNLTRFLVIGAAYGPPAGADKTSICFAVKHRAGALYSALGAFQRAGLNLTKIESRPNRLKAWEYNFFVDFEGHADAPPVARALRDLERHCTFLTVLGAYPRAVEAT